MRELLERKKKVLGIPISASKHFGLDSLITAASESLKGSHKITIENSSKLLVDHDVEVVFDGRLKGAPRFTNHN